MNGLRNEDDLNGQQGPQRLLTSAACRRPDSEDRMDKEQRTSEQRFRAVHDQTESRKMGISKLRIHNTGRRKWKFLQKIVSIASRFVSSISFD